MIISNLTLLIIFSIMYIIALLYLYFSKVRLDNGENKIYKFLVITNLIGLILQFMCDYVSFKYNTIPRILSDIVLKLYLVYFIVWVSLVILYLIEVSFKNKKIANIITVSSTIIISAIIFILPYELYRNINERIYYTYGSAVEFTFMISSVLSAIIFLILIIKHKKISLKKATPVYLFLLFGLAIMFIQIIHPELVITAAMESLICCVMYHTIENPDLKMISQLELAKNQAEKANRAKTDFLSSMSHEIRTPLNAIVGLSECIKNSDDIEEIHEDANDVVMASQTLLEIVNGILDISKIEADKMEIIEVEYNPEEVFKELTTLVNTRIGEKEIELRTNFASDIPETLYGDKGKIKQIITNLLTNAVKYTEKGYIDFNVKCINDKDESKLTITVSDTGRGIKKEQMDKLFTKFNRLEEDKNTTVEGTGLGLAITKSLVEMMGGKIVVDSTYGEGSKFTVFISQKISNEEIKEKVLKEENITYEGKKALIVDDNKLNLKVASKVLKEFNIETETIESGFECINKIENHEHYDIILMDIMMPKMSGVETLKKLKQIDNFNIPVIALTADVMEGKSNKYIEVGFNDYLRKPIEKEELKRVLNKFLNENSDNNEIKEERDMHKVIPVTDEDIEILNKKLAEMDAKKESNDYKKCNIEYLKENDIDVDSSIELLGDIDMYNDTLKTFIEENKTRIPRIKENKESRNMRDYSIDVHALKSDSKYLGFKKLAELSYDHELKSKEEDLEYINEHYVELMEEYDRISNIIGKYLGK